MVEAPPAPLRLKLDGSALQDNWRALDRLSGKAACGAAVKANGYGLGVREVVARLTDAGCRDFFVATWEEAVEIADLVTGLSLSVFHGVRAEDIETALILEARPCLNSAEQVARWKEAGGGPCDVMIDTGMNRLGLSAEEALGGLLDGLEIDTLMSHLACADEEDHPLNRKQCDALKALAGKTNATRLSLANSAGIALGRRYHFNLTRPGLSLYGGVQSQDLEDHIRNVVAVEAQVIQRRKIEPGDSVGYSATVTATEPVELAILNIGYADGYLRSFSESGTAYAGDIACPVIGLVSMDLIAVDVTDAPQIGEGDWLEIEYDLPMAAGQSGLSQYELLTGLGDRYQRIWL